MPSSPAHPATLPADQLLADCVVRTGRRRGPGGQHRNKVETAVTVVHQPTGVQGEATERRSQAQNKVQAIFRLRVNLALEVRSTGFVQGPSPLWQSRCRSGRIGVSPEHEDFPALLAEALDALARLDRDLSRVAAMLGVTTSQFVKLLKVEPRALQQVNAERQQLGLRPLL